RSSRERGGYTAAPPSHAGRRARDADYGDTARLPEQLGSRALGSRVRLRQPPSRREESVETRAELLVGEAESGRMREQEGRGPIGDPDSDRNILLMDTKRLWREELILGNGP